MRVSWFVDWPLNTHGFKFEESLGMMSQESGALWTNGVGRSSIVVTRRPNKGRKKVDRLSTSMTHLLEPGWLFAVGVVWGGWADKRQ